MRATDAGLTPAAPPPSTTPGALSSASRDKRPVPVVVCIENREATATASRAGVYTDGAPVDPATLNWIVAGVGCVTYPGLETLARARCGGAGTYPVVERTLCHQ